MQQSIDVVIAWVDGNDQKLKQKREQYTATKQIDCAENTRFASNNEIYYNIASILKYAKYVRHIYIVTDQQKPLWIDAFEQQGIAQKNQIQVIDHRILFQGYEGYLPTFNSLSIETMLWNIPNISSHFLYLNDDFFFNSSSKIEDFFDHEKIKIYGHWQSNAPLKIKFTWRKFLDVYFHQVPKAKYTIAQMLSSDMLNMSKYYEIHHRPHLISRENLQDFFEKNKSILIEQIQHKFRSFYQFLPVGLNNHLSILRQQAILEQDIPIAYLKNQDSLLSFEKELHDSNIKFGCIQSLDQFDTESREKVIELMNHKFFDYLPLPLVHQG